jgi:hypothetical protein
MAIKHKHRIWEKISAIFIIVVFLVAILGNVPRAAAGAVTNIWAMETNMANSGAGQLYLAFKVASAATAPTLSITMTGSTVATTNGNLVPETTVPGTPSTPCTTIFSWISGITVMPATLSATGSGAVISLATTGNLSATTAYCVVFGGSAAITNPSSAGIYNVTISDTPDTGSAYYVVLSSPANTFNVTASVAQTFTLSVAGGPDAIGTLSTSQVKYGGGVTATVSSNAANGVSLFAYDGSHQGLYSSSTTGLIPSLNPNNTAIQTLTGGSGTAAYITTASYLTNTSGAALTVTTPFAGSDGTATSTGDGLSPIPAVIAYNSAPTNGAQVKLVDAATPSAITPEATDYTDTVTVVGSGSF